MQAFLFFFRVSIFFLSVSLYFRSFLSLIMLMGSFPPHFVQCQNYVVDQAGRADEDGKRDERLTRDRLKFPEVLRIYYGDIIYPGGRLLPDHLGDRLYYRLRVSLTLLHRLLRLLQ